jgi:hypothetical protein
MLAVINESTRDGTRAGGLRPTARRACSSPMKRLAAHGLHWRYRPAAAPLERLAPSMPSCALAVCTIPAGV